ncbi:sulfotransferase family protein [Pontibacter anaerobius]|uniref:Sulfotransferase n=1 Tax=Pontibacter anaerobius TaxID=2993940 RepID=A0ABT3RFE4_9BACT|nr:sulfotransferase [Pontibacter anaerobius]MCX2739960.1 sulfotransferase [Pontibacter anaerobius]
MAEKSIKHRLVARYRRNKALSFLLDKTGKKIEGKKWVFIIGCYNSGTTLLEEVLSTHPEMSSLNDEGVMLTDKLTRPEDFFWRRMWSECEQDLQVNDEESAEVAKRHWSHFYDLSKPVLLEKSIVNTIRIDYLNRYFKEAFFIHLVRNGYAVAEGIYRKATVMEGNHLYAENGKYPLELCAKQWARSLEVVEQTKSKAENFIEVTYEDFTSNPDKVLRDITDFIHVQPFSSTFKDNVFKIHNVESNIKNMNGSSLKKLSAEDVVIINNVAYKYLDKYGYLIK